MMEFFFGWSLGILIGVCIDRLLTMYYIRKKTGHRLYTPADIADLLIEYDEEFAKHEPVYKPIM